MWKTITILSLACIALGYCCGVVVTNINSKPEVIMREISTVWYQFPTTPPYKAFADPIDFEEALLLLNGMKVSHQNALEWTFTSNPGFGIADSDYQNQCIKWYDQLIDFIWWQQRNGEK